MLFNKPLISNVNKIVVKDLRVSMKSTKVNTVHMVVLVVVLFSRYDSTAKLGYSVKIYNW